MRAHASPSAERADVSKADMLAGEASEADGWKPAVHSPRFERRGRANSGLASAQARAPSFESYFPQHPGMYTAIPSPGPGASMQRVIPVEFQICPPATPRSELR